MDVFSEHFNERLRETRVTIHDLDECEKYVTEDLELWIYNDTLCMQNTNPYSPLCSVSHFVILNFALLKM